MKSPTAWTSSEKMNEAPSTPSWICGRISVHPLVKPSEPTRISVLPDAVAGSIGIPFLAPLHLPLIQTLEPCSDCGDRDAEIGRLRRELAHAALQMADLRQEILVTSEHQLVSLAVAIAKRVVGRELQSDPGLVRTWATEAMSALGDLEQITIAIAPDLAEALPPEAWETSCPVVVDPSLGRSRCEVRSRESSVASGFDARFLAMAEAFGDS